MSLRRYALMMVVAASISAPACAGSSLFIDVDLAPPAPRYEVVPVARPGYVWAPGFWFWEGRRHVWHPGHWVVERPGYIWVADGWEQRGPRWHYNPGHWEPRVEEVDYHGHEWVRYRRWH